MSFTKLEYLPEALLEYEDAAAFYEAAQPGLGERLIEQVDEVLALALEFPDALAPVGDVCGHGLRSIRTHSFPIKIIIVPRGDSLVVVALFHERRRPGYWRKRLRDVR